MNRGFRYFFSISIVFLFTIVIYFLITGAPLSAQSSAVRKALPDQVARRASGRGLG